MSTIHFIVLFLVVLFTALTAAFTILLIGKLGIRNYIIARAPKLISQLFECDFCLSFWISVILAVILAIFFSEFSILFIPILSTPITRILL